MSNQYQINALESAIRNLPIIEKVRVEVSEMEEGRTVYSYVRIKYKWYIRMFCKKDRELAQMVEASVKDQASRVKGHMFVYLTDV